MASLQRGQPVQRQGEKKNGEVTGGWVEVVRERRVERSAGTISTRPAKELGSVEELVFSFLCPGHQKIPGFLWKRVLRICARQRRGRGKQNGRRVGRKGREGGGGRGEEEKEKEKKEEEEKERRKRKRRKEERKRRGKETGLKTKDFFL